MQICNCANCSKNLAILGLKRPATFDEVTLAYKDLVKVWHPDRFESDRRLRNKAEEEFKNVQQAFSGLREHIGNRGAEEPASSYKSTSPAGYRAELTLSESAEIFRGVIDGSRIFHASGLPLTKRLVVSERFGKDEADLRVVVDTSLTKGFGSGVLFTNTHIVQRAWLDNHEFAYPALGGWSFSLKGRRNDFVDRLAAKIRGGTEDVYIEAKDGANNTLSFGNLLDHQTLPLYQILLNLKSRFA